MLVTEEEAKEKTCTELITIMTMVQIFQAVTDASVTTADIDESKRIAFCVGSDCMAWRWHSSEGQGSKRTGYCGKAGK